MKQGDETATLRRGIRIDLLIALCALLISSLATAAAWWQSRVVAQQLSAQVWPYLSMQVTTDKRSVSLAISNEGLGPARVRSIEMMVDRVPRRYFTDVLKALARGKRIAPRGSFTDVQRGNVIRVGGGVTLFHVVDAPSIRALITGYHRLSARVCYCAIIPGNCWIIERTADATDSAEPRPVYDCPPAGPMFKSGVAP